MTRRRLSLLLLVLVLAASCTVPRERTSTDVSTIPVDREQVERILQRYESVRATAGRLLDAKPLSTVESGAVLAIDTGSFEVAQRLEQAAGEQARPEGQVVQVATPRFSSYPLWFVVEVRDEADEVNRVQVFERTSAVDPWLLVASPQTVLSTELPDVRRRDGVALRVPADSDTGMSLSPQGAADAYAATLADPDSDASATVEQDDFIEQMRAAAADNSALEGVTFTQDWAAQEVTHALRTSDGGALVFATLERTDRYEVGDGVRVQWPAGSPQSALLESGLSSEGSLTYLHQVLILVPGGESKPRVIGQFGGVTEADTP